MNTRYGRSGRIRTDGIEVPNSIANIQQRAFYGAGLYNSDGVRQLLIEFQGTKAEWNAIEKGSSWDNDSNENKITKIICRDGVIEN